MSGHNSRRPPLDTLPEEGNPLLFSKEHIPIWIVMEIVKLNYLETAPGCGTRGFPPPFPKDSIVKISQVDYLLPFMFALQAQLFSN